jgi:hypothetical protein
VAYGAMRIQVVAALAARALTFIDRPGRHAGPVTNGTLNSRCPTGSRAWLPHHLCRCSRRSGT